MGCSPSKSQVPEQTFTPDISIINESHSSPFGKVQLAKDNKTGQEMYITRICFHQEENFQNKLDYYYTRINNPHPNLCNVIGYTSEHYKQFCSEFYKISLYLANISHNMKDELDKAIENRQPISEIELQLLSQHLILILVEFQKKGLTHGNIRPANIFVTDEAYKICEPSLNGIQRSESFIYNYEAYLAPELLQKVAIGNYDMKGDRYKADVFSLGMTLLSLATLTKSEELYNYEKGIIDLNMLESKIVKVESIYSRVFSKFLRELLTMNPKDRPDFIQLYDRITIADTIKGYYESTVDEKNEKVPYVKVAKTMGEGEKERLEKIFYESR